MSDAYAIVYCQTSDNAITLELSDAIVSDKVRHLVSDIAIACHSDNCTSIGDVIGNDIDIVIITIDNNNDNVYVTYMLSLIYNIIYIIYYNIHIH